MKPINYIIVFLFIITVLEVIFQNSLGGIALAIMFHAVFREGVK